MAVGGDILEITYNHPTLGTGTIFPKASEEASYDLGGFKSNDDASMVASSGEMIDQINQTRWFFSVSVTWDMNVREDLEKIAELAADTVLADWTFTHINGTVYAGKGKPVGTDLAGNGNTSTFPLKVSGGGKLKKI